MTAEFRKDLAFQRYQIASGEVVAAYALAENRFTVLEDDAALLMGRVLGGMDPQALLSETEILHGQVMRNEVAAFFDQVLPLFFSNSQENSRRHTPAGSAQSSLGEEEDRFFIRCSDTHQFATAAWELSYACNLRCIHCYNPHHESQGQLETDEWIDLLDQGRELGLLRLCLTGGESGIHPGFWSIMAKARSKYMAIDVLTNGLVFADKGAAEDLASLFPRSVQCSLYGAKAETHEAITGVPGSWRETIQCLEHFSARGVPIAVKCPAMGGNYREIPEVAQIADRLGAVLQVDVNITARNDGENSPTHLRLDEAQLAWLFRQPNLPLYQGLERIDQFGLVERTLTDSVCGAGTNGLSIQPDGTVIPCLSFQLPVGQVRRQRLKEIWEGKPIMEWREKKHRDRVGCKNCELLSLCSFCPGISLNDAATYLSPNTNDCRVARVRATTLSELPPSNLEPARI